MMVTTHYAESAEAPTACGREPLKLAWSTSIDETSCKACKKAAAHQFVGESRGRKQFKIVCKGGPWGGSEAVFPKQESGDLSLPIRVGEHAGRYNLNTGHWVPLEQRA